MWGFPCTGVPKWSVLNSSVYPDAPNVMSAGVSSVYPDSNPSVLKKFRHSYNSFAPRVRLTWTPGQYYYMSGDRKINLHSKYPHRFRTLGARYQRCHAQHRKVRTY